MRSYLATIGLIVLLGWLGTACGPLDDISSGKAFLEAFPSEDTLILQTGTGDIAQQKSGLRSISQAMVGDRADLHDLSFYVAWQVNNQARDIFNTIWFITRFQPSQAVLEDGILGEGDDQLTYDARAVWGPFSDDEGKNLEFILHVWRCIDPDDGRRTFIWFAAGRPKQAGDDAWVPFLYGGAKPLAGSNGSLTRQGIVEVDCDAIRLLDPTEDDIGSATYAFEEGTGYSAVAAVGEDVWTDDTHTKTGNATYFYGHTSEGYTVLDFDVDADLQVVDGTAAKESLHVRTGWLDNGNGRSDANASGGDLGDASAELTECWGINLLQTYFHLLTPDGEIENGNVSSCFSIDPIQAPQIDYQAIRDLFSKDF